MIDPSRQGPQIVDLSHWVQPVDFGKLKAAGIVGVIHKATQGQTYFDLLYSTRREQAEAAGLLWGAFHFGSGTLPHQAARFIDFVRPTKGILLALDFEHSEIQMSIEQAQQFARDCFDAAGVWPWLYGGDLLRDLTPDTAGCLIQCRSWLSSYTAQPTPLRAWLNWGLWQYTDGKQGPWAGLAVDGVGLCDRSVFNGTEDELRAAWAS